MDQNTLVIMAAGMGSRFGGIKQLASMGPAGEIIMDYSIYDAIEAGFKKVVFIIRKDIKDDFMEIVGNRISSLIDTEFVYQEIEALPEGYTVPQGRTKPWGTGQAILACKDVVKTPFAVINADDYYGKEGFKKINQYLNTMEETSRKGGKMQACMVGFILENTLSENGSVTRGLCRVEEGMLSDIEETFDIERNSEGVIVAKGGQVIPEGSIASMNMWGFTPEIFDELEKRFPQFLDGISGNEMKAEFLLPSIVGDLLEEGKMEVKVLTSKDKWFGVTYKEDVPSVRESFKKLTDAGVYPEKLF